MSYNKNNPREIYIPAKTLAVLIGGALLIFVVVVGGSQATHVVEPGNRGVRVTLGKVSPAYEQEGLVVKPPFITSIHDVSVRQQTKELTTEFYSADLQQVSASMRILYRIPENSVVALFQQFEKGTEPFDDFVAPRVVEALKEVASTQSAEEIVQNRDRIKQETLDAVRQKIGEVPGGGGPLIMIQDITLSGLALSPELNAAIEQKMTQREEAERAKFVQQQAEIEAETAIIRARGEGQSIEIRGQALRESPAFIRFQIVEKWDGVSPIVIGGEGEAGANIMVPMEELERKN